MSVAEVTDRLGLHKLRRHRWYIQATCAVTGEGLYEGIDWLTGSFKDLHDENKLVPSAGGSLGEGDALTKAAK